MCAIFGIIDYKKALSKVQREQMLKVLANECMSRGTDATGISYLKNDNLTIYKRPKKANKMRFKLPVDSNIVMGHTRMTTQGNEKFNFNNHPFLGRTGKTKFALAHNGVIYNDTSLRNSEKLPETHIETDSYVAVQLIEKDRILNFKSIKNMAEKVSGSFCFSILDDERNLYLVKGSNPLCIMHFRQGFYVYASTQDIVTKFMEKLKLNLLKHTEICLDEGDILRIDCRGNLNKTKFEFDSLGYYLSRRSVMYSHEFLNDNFYLEDIKSVASSFGYTLDDVDKLISQGFTLEEIEEFFYGYIYQEIFIDKASGKNKDRVELQKILDFVRKGDTVIVESISRFARNTKDLLELIDILNSKQVVFISKKEAIDTTTPTGKFMLTIFGAVAELEREYILSRQKEGIEIAKLEGKYTGRKPKEYIDFDRIIFRWKNGEISATDAMKYLKMSSSTFYNTN